MLGGRAVSPLVGVRPDAIQGWNCSDQEPMGAKRRPSLLLIQQGGKGNRGRRLRPQVSLINPGECLLGTVFFGVFNNSLIGMQSSMPNATTICDWPMWANLSKAYYSSDAVSGNGVLPLQENPDIAGEGVSPSSNITTRWDQNAVGAECLVFS